MENKPQNPHRPEWQWNGRSLDNFKQMHMKRAQEKGVADQLKAARTLTQARKIIFGVKQKQKGR